MKTENGSLRIFSESASVFTIRRVLGLMKNSLKIRGSYGEMARKGKLART